MQFMDLDHLFQEITSLAMTEIGVPLFQHRPRHMVGREVVIAVTNVKLDSFRRSTFLMVNSTDGGLNRLGKDHWRTKNLPEFCQGDSRGELLVI
jgi:hypothetical protein